MSIAETEPFDGLTDPFVGDARSFLLAALGQTVDGIWMPWQDAAIYAIDLSGKTITTSELRQAARDLEASGAIIVRKSATGGSSMRIAVATDTAGDTPRTSIGRQEQAELLSNIRQATSTGSPEDLEEAICRIEARINHRVARSNMAIVELRIARGLVGNPADPQTREDFDSSERELSLLVLGQPTYGTSGESGAEEEPEISEVDPAVRADCVRLGFYVPTIEELRECRGDWLFADGGVIGPNPSAIGGTWAWIYVQDGEEIASGFGIVDPSEVGFSEEYGSPVVTNNISELYAVCYGIEYLIGEYGADILSGWAWPGTIVSDSKVTLCRRRPTAKYKGVPSAIEGWARELFKYTESARFTLVDGHPTPKQLKRGVGKRGNHVSSWNVKCDDLCNLAKSCGV